MLLITAVLGTARAPRASETTQTRLMESASRQDTHMAPRVLSVLPFMRPIWASANVTRREAPQPATPRNFRTKTVLPGTRGCWLPPKGPLRWGGSPLLWKTSSGPADGALPLGGTEAGLADGPERERHARHERVPRVRGQGRVGGGVGRHGPVAQRGRVDVRVEAGGQRRVWRLLHRARYHQLEQAANTRTRVRHTAAGLACPLVDAAPRGRESRPGDAVASHMHWERHGMHTQNTEVSRGGNLSTRSRWGWLVAGGWGVGVEQQEVTWRWQD